MPFLTIKTLSYYYVRACMSLFEPFLFLQVLLPLTVRRMSWHQQYCHWHQWVTTTTNNHFHSKNKQKQNQIKKLIMLYKLQTSTLFLLDDVSASIRLSSWCCFWAMLYEASKWASSSANKAVATLSCKQMASTWCKHMAYVKDSTEHWLYRACHLLVMLKCQSP